MTPEEQWLLQKERTLAWLRLGFSLTAILLIQLNPQWTGIFPILSDLFLYSFFLYSLLVIYRLTSPERPNSRKIGFVTACLDLLWTSSIVLSTVAPPMPNFAFFLFPIITSGFRYGIKGSLSVALISATIYGFIAFAPLWGRPIETEAFVIFTISLLVLSYVFGSLFELEMKQIQKLMSLCNSAAQLATQKERRRIARELHDRVLQVLGSLTYRLEACRKSLVDSPIGILIRPKGLEQELALSEEAARVSMTEIRSVLSGKVTGQFTPGTLLERLGEEIKSLDDSLGLKVVLEATPENLELGQEVEQEIYYAAREGLTNIARHSRASEASLSLKQTNGELRVSLEDNGLGFEPTAKGDGSSYGLQSMRERVSSLGGDFSIKTAPGMGTRISFAVPLSPARTRPGLNERLLDQLGETRREGSLGWSSMASGLAAAFALLLIVAVPYFFWQGRFEENIFTDAIARYQKVTQGIVDTPRAASSVGTPARLLDLSPLGYHILSWRTHRVRGQEGRFFFYQGQGMEYLLAQEFEGAEFSPPPGGKVIQTANQNFVSYSSEGVNLVAWKQDDLLCIFTSTIPRENLLRLAQQISMGS